MPKLSEIKTVSEFFEILDWDFDGSGLVITDAGLLEDTIAGTFTELIDDRPMNKPDYFDLMDEELERDD